MEILLVDHTNLYRAILGKSLADDGISLRVAASAQEALDLVAGQTFQLVVTSMQLPDRDGVELTREMRTLPQLRHVPILVLTGAVSRDLALAAESAGVTEIFRKQEIEELVNFMRRFLLRYSALHGRVLYVEDSRDQRLVMTEQLKWWDLKVDAFHNADEAWEPFMSNDYDLVITDIVLDGRMSGSRFVNRIRRQSGPRGDVPILAVTAFDTAARRVELFHLGVSDYVTKPVLPEELHARIHSLVSTKLIADRDRELLNASHVGVVTTNDKGVIQFCNAELQRLFGYQEKELLGKSITILMSAPARAEHDQHLERYLATGQSLILNGMSREVQARRRDGSEFPILLSVTEMHHFGRRVFAGMIRDLSQERAATPGLV